MIIGLTGGIASGKTTATEILQALDIPIIDADLIAREITQPGHPVLKKLADTFGEAILENGVLNRKALRNIAFETPEKTNQLNSITHPAIHALLIEQLITTNPNPYKVLSAPLLFENGLDDLCDETWLIDIDRQTQINRIQKRDHCDIQSAKNIIDKQLSYDIKREKSDFLIDNNQSIRLFKDLIISQHQQTLEKCK